MADVKKEFVQKYLQAARSAAMGSQILPETIITVAALESGYGKSLLSSKYNNFFGRKPETSWAGKVVNLDTTEVLQGKTVKIKQPFKVYETPQQAFLDYVRLLSRSARYKKVLLAKTPQEQFKELQAAGYATDPGYSSKLTSLLGSLKAFITPSVLSIAIGVGFFF